MEYSSLQREMGGLKGRGSFQNVESNFTFARCIRPGSVEAPWLCLKMAMQMLRNVEREWKRKEIGLHIETCQEGCHQIWRFMWADNYWILSHSKMHQEQMMMKELIEEAERWDLEPKTG